MSQGCDGPRDFERPRDGRGRPFEGSLRQQRGRLLRRVLAEGAVAIEPADAAAASGLAADGLATLEAGWLRPPA